MHPIAFHRKARGWTQADLGGMVNVSTLAVRCWERGAVPRPKTLSLLASVFEMNGEDLLREINEWKPREGDAA